jgi:protein ImuB
MYGGLHSPLPFEAALLDLAREFTPRVEVRRGAVLLDLRGLGRRWPDPEALGKAILEKAHAHVPAARVALAWARVVALIVARAREGLTIVPAGQEAAILAPLPLTFLDLPPEQEERFRRWGLRTLGELAELPPLGLAERLGPTGPHLIRLARGEDETPLVPTPPPEAFECTLDLDWPVEGLEPLAFLLSRVLESLCGALESRGQRACSLTLELGLVDGSRNERTQKTVAPTGEPRTWRTLLLLDLEAHPPGDAIQRITVRAEPTPSRSVQFSLLDPAQPSPERLAETLGRLQVWTSTGRGGSPALLDSHRPGAFVVESFSPGRGRKTTPLPPPRVALRAFRPPVPATVVLQDGVPAFVLASAVRGRVLERAGPWRASGDWWDKAWSREEWDVALVDGGLYRIFRDCIQDAWFVEGELD